MKRYKLNGHSNSVQVTPKLPKELINRIKAELEKEKLHLESQVNQFTQKHQETLEMLKALSSL